jgi:hypothetical protein
MVRREITCFDIPTSAEDRNSYCLSLKWDKLEDDDEDTSSYTVLPISAHLEGFCRKIKITGIPHELNVCRCRGLVLEPAAQETRTNHEVHVYRRIGYLEYVVLIPDDGLEGKLPFDQYDTITLI